MKLNLAAQIQAPDLKDLEKNCEMLTPFGTATRYPGGAMVIGPEHMGSVMAWAESIRRIIRSYFDLKEPDSSLP